MTDGERDNKTPNLPQRLLDASPGLVGWGTNFTLASFLLAQGLHPEPILHPDMPPPDSLPNSVPSIVIIHASTTSSPTSAPSIMFHIKG
jgi:hypothetical protein